MKVVATVNATLGMLWAFWDRNVRPTEGPEFNPQKHAELIRMMSPTKDEETGTYYPGGFDRVKGAGVVVEEATLTDKELAISQLKARRQVILDKANTGDVGAVARLHAQDYVWGGLETIGDGIKYIVSIGNCRFFSLFEALSAAFANADKLGVTIQEIKDTFSLVIPVDVVQYVSISEKRWHQLTENTQAKAGFKQIEWQDYYLAVRELIREGACSQSECRDRASSATIGQRTWHLVVLENLFPQLKISDRLLIRDKQLQIPGPMGWLDWSKMDHRILPNVSRNCQPDKVAAWNARCEQENRFGDMVPRVWDASDVENKLQEMMTGAKPVALSKAEKQNLKVAAHPAVRAAAVAMDTGDTRLLSEINNTTRSAVAVQRIYSRDPVFYTAVESLLTRLADLDNPAMLADLKVELVAFTNKIPSTNPLVAAAESLKPKTEVAVEQPVVVEKESKPLESTPVPTEKKGKKAKA